ncbi:N(2)-acetyl-L-2,4-diaminobutanoate deacetylase DoeB2 [Suttonella sp. R2A3]|uniref:N(2)-acetyl-L-2,4-diaminobutanoate deacetylase DoeB2 n=1 Tax=Suttonella sp. R2A3 TaxID=2908648 RepID=UPI001F3B999F|nr:N(2)-acetyl-L-2,4-diaminobutanoate deacetylase DoeB2 [Suttonella sp. R2A3]UJF23774.1 N(2)-acetyl-L-2,4-diaminobutanoate deacetylase DoeB2 [Suttonella sp. R2A3]
MPSFEELITFTQAIRHRLHQQPELGWQEHNTAAYIREVLSEHGIEWQALAETGTIATLAPNAPGEMIALRADIDGLPISEQNNLPWRSQTTDTMHACGHDGHSATLIATAIWLKQHEDQLPQPVRLVFQPAEEGGHGAKAMIEAGALKDVSRIYGWHNWPAIPFGQAVCPDGAVMAGNGTFNITIQGKGGHASQPEQCADPVLAASAIVLNLQQIVARRIAPQHKVVVSVTGFDAPSADTVIPETAKLNGCIRLADTTQRAQINALISEIVAQTALSYGVQAEVIHHNRYQATVNEANTAKHMREAIALELGDSWQSPQLLPIMASEDFSYYGREIPAAFALIGAGIGDNDPACHSPIYDFNDDLIPVVTKLYCRLAGLPISTK